ncbi:hypothetical protein [Pseudochrobactrum sp. HB0163]|uniref:hypothetical protein n=1 Tax=Pseudochrobactrum sp. HB0163 TaxID=3450708 RepID=UPI003F6DC3C1
MNKPEADFYPDTVQCEECAAAIAPEAPRHVGYECFLCAACAPTYDDMLNVPGDFLNNDGELKTFKEAVEIARAHIAKGGKLTDKILSGGTTAGAGK